MSEPGALLQQEQGIQGETSLQHAAGVRDGDHRKLCLLSRQAPFRVPGVGKGVTCCVGGALFCDLQGMVRPPDLNVDVCE